jgi:hypothetical protein
MPDDSVRIELAFEGGQIIAAMVAPQAADAVERAVSSGAGGAVEIETDDGRITIVASRVVYLKRFTKGSQPGFAAY